MVWLALECKNVEYLTVLVSKNEDGDANVPRIVWPHDVEDTVSQVTDPLQLIEQIQSHYPDSPPLFYPKLSSAVDASRCNIMRLPGVMPRNSDPDFMNLAPYLFRGDGTLVKKSSHCVSLEELEEMLEEYYLGPYLCGKEITAADIVWIPYLERYAIQLPLLFPKIDVLNPRSSSAYELVHEWYLAMERNVPPYACAVQGDARHWRRCLEKVLPLHNSCATSEEEMVKTLSPIPKNKGVGWWLKKNPRAEELWSEYVKSRPWLADTPGREVGTYLIRCREEIVATMAGYSSRDNVNDRGLSMEEADEALREVVQILIHFKMDGSVHSSDNVEQLSENARRMAAMVCERIEVPRDMGMIPALALWSLIQLAPFSKA